MASDKHVNSTIVFSTVDMRPNGTYILPVLHPASYFRNQTMRFTGDVDWEKAVRIQREGPTLVHPPIERWQWEPSLEDVQLYFGCTQLQGGDLGWADPGPWSIDFEATLNREVVCLGIWSCHEPTRHRGICIPFLSQYGKAYWNPSEEQAVMGMVRDFFMDRARPKIGQNTVGYDTGFPPFHERSLLFQAWGIWAEGMIGDTMAAHHTCFPELKHNLAFLSSIATDMGPYKDELWEDEEDEEDDDELDWSRILERPDEKVRVYCMKDAFATAMVWNGLSYEME